MEKIELELIDEEYSAMKEIAKPGKSVKQTIMSLIKWKVAELKNLN